MRFTHLTATAALKLAMPLALPLVATFAQAGLPPEFDLEMSGFEYRSVRAERKGILSKTEAQFSPIFRAGERNLQWIEAVNHARTTAGQPLLELSSAATQRGIPIDQPGRSNPTLIQAKFEAVAQEAPTTYWSVVTTSSASLPTTIPAGMSDEDFVAIARKTDKVYQDASRWSMQEPYLSQYKARARGDIRGYYFLSKDANLDANLKGFAKLPVETRAQYSTWLVGECRNTGKSPTSCAAELARVGAPAFHNTYLADARETFQTYFQLEGARSDVTWNSQNPNSFEIPFAIPESVGDSLHTPAEVQDWLKVNIEDEWRQGDWQLHVNFRKAGFFENLTHVVFAAGATPHVNGLGGNEITMDANRNIQEYTSRWTIRHEYGHTLGLPDCYIEFYDETEDAMINYQIDTSNLMCSRKGHILPIHVEELKKAYYR